MLSLISGPTDIVPADPLEAAVLVSTGYSRGFWQDGRGLYFIADTGSTHAENLYVVGLGGKAIRVGSRSDGAGSWNALAQSPDDRLHTIGTLLGYWWKTQLPAVPQIGSVFANAPGDVVLPDRKVRFVPGASARVLAAAYGDGLSAAEFYFAGGTPTSGAGVGAMCDAGLVAGHRFLWCIDQGNGSIVQYDATAKAEGPAPRTSLGAGVRLAGYSPKLDIFVAVRRDTGRTPNVDQLYVFANEPVAASISAPSFSSSPKRGALVTVSARVLGASSEPCGGRNVSFATTSGAVEPEVVATDATGLASSLFRCPFAAGGATVTATLEE